MRYFRLLLALCIAVCCEIGLNDAKVWGSNYTIHLVFETSFDGLFEPDSAWATINRDSVKSMIVDRVTEDFEDFDIGVSTTGGDVTIYISGHRFPGSADVLGFAPTLWGSFVIGGYAEVYAQNFANQSVFQWPSTRFTVQHIGEAIAGTTSHEGGHLFNTYHEYMWNTYDPTIDGVLDGHKYPKGRDQVVNLIPGDNDQHKWHLMASEGFISITMHADRNRYFSDTSEQTLLFASHGGYEVTRNMTWGISGEEFTLQRDVSIQSGKRFIAGRADYKQIMNGFDMIGPVEHQPIYPGDRSFVPYIFVRGGQTDSTFSGQFGTSIGATKFAFNSGAVDTPFVNVEDFLSSGEWDPDHDIDSILVVEPRDSSLAATWMGGGDHTFVKYGRNSGTLDRVVVVETSADWGDSVAVFAETNDVNFYFKIGGWDGTPSEFLQVPRYCRTDYDSLGTVDFPDWIRFASHWGMEEGVDVDYEQRYDLSGNRKVDTPDSAIFVGDFGKSCGQLPKPAMPLLAMGKNRDAKLSLVMQEAGNEVVADMRLADASGLVGYEAMLHYDDRVLEYAGVVDEGGLLKRQNAAVGFVKEGKGSLLIVSAIKKGYVPSAGSGSLTRIMFRKRGAMTDAPPVWVAGLKVADDAFVVDHLVVGEDIADAQEESENLWITGLGQNTPNPFNPSTVIAFSLSDAGTVDVVIYNVLGQEVRRLLSGAHLSAGQHQVVWDGRDGQGQMVSSGVYLYRMQVGHFEGVQRMVMLK